MLELLAYYRSSDAQISHTIGNVVQKCFSRFREEGEGGSCKIGNNGQDMTGLVPNDAVLPSSHHAVPRRRSQKRVVQGGALRPDARHDAGASRNELFAEVWLKARCHSSQAGRIGTIDLPSVIVPIHGGAVNIVKHDAVPTRVISPSKDRIFSRATISLRSHETSMPEMHHQSRCASHLERFV